jgi:Tfp pilus assembly protein PilN
MWVFPWESGAVVMLPESFTRLFANLRKRVNDRPKRMILLTWTIAVLTAVLVAGLIIQLLPRQSDSNQRQEIQILQQEVQQLKVINSTLTIQKSHK